HPFQPNEPQKVPFHSYDISTQLGGPILRDQLWFFVGYQYPHHETASSFGSPLLTTDTAPKMFNKVTYKWNDQNTLQGFFEFNNANRESTFTHPEANTLSQDSQRSWNATWISLLGSNTTLEASLAGFHSDYKLIEDNPDLPGHAVGAPGAPWLGG